MDGPTHGTSMADICKYRTNFRVSVFPTIFMLVSVKERNKTANELLQFLLHTFSVYLKLDRLSNYNNNVIH